MTALPLNAIIKLCGCGAAYDAETWAKLPLCGYVGAYWASSKRIAVELRHCGCKSTIGVEVEVAP